MNEFPVANEKVFQCVFAFLRGRKSLRESDYAVKELPQPQPPEAFGLLKVKPEPITLLT